MTGRNVCRPYRKYFLPGQIAFLVCLISQGVDELLIDVLFWGRTATGGAQIDGPSIGLPALGH